MAKSGGSALRVRFAAMVVLAPMIAVVVILTDPPSTAEGTLARPPASRSPAGSGYIATDAPAEPVTDDWAVDRLPPLPDPIGFAGGFAGVSRDRLVFAGGANFPDRPPWEGGDKVWHDRVFVLEPGEANWTEIPLRLPVALAYGVSVTWRDRVILIGGGDADRHYARSWSLRSSGAGWVLEEGPDLPGPLAFHTGALIGDRLVLAGGIEEPRSTEALASVVVLELRDSMFGERREAARWQEARPIPGGGRLLAISGAGSDAFYLVGGVSLTENEGGPERILPYLSDAWRLDLASLRWNRLADLPRPAAAAASPMPYRRDGRQFYLLGGDDGSRVGEPIERHPGFDPAVYRYDVDADRWTRDADLPAGISRVTLPAVRWGEAWVLASGESRPGVRSPDVFRLEFHATR